MPENVLSRRHFLAAGTAAAVAVATCASLDLRKLPGLDRYRPLSADYRGVRMLTNPPPSSGGLLIVFALKLLEAVHDLGTIPFGSTEQIGIVAEVLESSNRARL